MAAVHRADYVPAEPVREALRRYLTENGAGEIVPPSEYQPGRPRTQRYSSAYGVLAEKLEVRPDTVFSWAERARHKSMRFDVADRILTAIGQPNLWWQDPQLSEVYESACKGADRIYPLKVAA